MASRRGRFRRGQANKENSGLRLEPDNAESRPVNTRGPAKTDGERGRDDGVDGGENSGAARSTLNPESNVWVPTSSLPTASGSKEFGAGVEQGSREETDVTIKADMDNQKGLGRIVNYRLLKEERKKKRNYRKEEAVYIHNGPCHDTAHGPAPTGAIGDAVAPDGNQASATRGIIKARANTIATPGGPSAGANLFDQMTFQLLNKTLRDSDGGQPQEP
ncbi:hypothetical protein HIM_05103 [Hirsutella minnesotensis 3608]|uniref:Uncharacterized protein n=1 Tax=Hirsutella minnesotensis 3608 TaxID=1043627 RepID=A0A0F7ZPK1_9HYPO|nr:hypothetical protein HIM_05103 [Hirsutella minnesotensis 3608]